ncbi:MAG: hypothetical protein GDA41_09695 [Rhodospirillales bacterium]|nr:hypothetical protein [Rhodospirillales bacterium]
MGRPQCETIHATQACVGDIASLYFALACYLRGVCSFAAVEPIDPADAEHCIGPTIFIEG